MRPYRHRITASIACLAYLLASALSGSLHSHSHDDAHAHQHCDVFGGEHANHPAAHDDHLADLGDTHDDAPSPAPLSDDDCAACRFVAQAAVFSVPTPGVAPRPIAAEVRVVTPSFFIAPVQSSRLARAPPLG